MNRKEKIEKYGNAYTDLMAFLKDISPEQMAYKPAPGKWSGHEVIVHIADAEANSFVRLRKTLAEPRTMVMAFDQDVWATALNYQAQNLEDNLELFRLLRKMNHDMIKDMPDENWALHYDHPEYGLVPLDRWLDMYTNHVSNHIMQIQRNMAAFAAAN